MYTFRIYEYNRARHDEKGEIAELISMLRVEPVKCEVLFSANGAAIIERKFSGNDIRLVMPSNCIFETKEDCAKACLVVNTGLDKQDADTLANIEKIRELNRVDIDKLCDDAAREIVAAVGGDKLKLSRAQRRFVKKVLG